MAEIYQLPEGGGSSSGVGNIPFSIPIGGFGGNGGIVFCRFLADCSAKGTSIFWDLML